MEVIRRFLICGRTGVGKSSFVNATFGITLANTSDFQACTTTVEYYAQNTFWGDICLIDTPGLAEDTLERDQEYLALIKREVNLNEIFALLYLSKLHETRLYADEKRTLELLIKYLGIAIWQRAWLFLTFAASVPDLRRADAASKRIQQIEGYLRQVINQNGMAGAFDAFQQRYLIDNVVRNWCSDGKPVTAVLTS